MVPQNRPTKLDFWYFFTFVCCNACSVGVFKKSSNFVNHFCGSRSYKNRPHFCSTKLAYKIDENCFPFLGGPSEPDITGSRKPIAESVGNWHTPPPSAGPRIQNVPVQCSSESHVFPVPAKIVARSRCSPLHACSRCNAECSACVCVALCVLLVQLGGSRTN
jgi:hypothetical protein